jgi:addiction module HigA family antidote
MINGVFASDSKMAMPMTLKSATTTNSERNNMAIPNTSGIQRKPTHPGEMLREDFIPDYGLSVTALAEAIGVSRQSVNELLRERRAVSPEMAIRLGRLFGNTPEFWLNAQRAIDLWIATQTIKDEVEQIKPLQAA